MVSGIVCYYLLFQVLSNARKPRGSRKASVFNSGFEFVTAGEEGEEEEDRGWRVNDSVIEMASKRQVSRDTLSL